MFDFSNYLTKTKFYDETNKLVAGKIKNKNCRYCNWRICQKEAKDAFIFSRQKQWAYKVKGVNRNVVEKITHNE